MSRDTGLTEADLQARLRQQLERVFPMFGGRFVLERQLRLRLGHREVTVDGMAPSGELRGRYDMIAELDGRPLLLAELKAPDVSLRDVDVQQALSYARTHQPPVPLVLLTNGVDVAVYRSYDGTPLEPASLDHESLETTLASAAALANAEVADAVRVLLGSSRPMWVALARQWSEDARRQLTGPIARLSSPIASGFVVPRVVCGEVEAHMRAGVPIVVVHGEPMSGVTSVLAQLSASAADEPRVLVPWPLRDILQHLANLLTRHIGLAVSKDDVRGWLNARRGLVPLTLILDGLPTVDFDELVELAEAGGLRLVLGMDTASLSRASLVAGRGQATALGRLAERVHVGLLDDVEFAEAERLIEAQLGSVFLTGAKHCLEFRRPRTLRGMLAGVPEASGVGDLRAVLPSVYNPQHLAQAGRGSATNHELFTDVGLLAKAFLDDVEQRAAQPDGAALAETWWAASVDMAAADRDLGSARVSRLLDSGLLAPLWSQPLGARYVIRLGDLLLYHIAQHWAGRLGGVTESADMVSVLDAILGTSQVIAGGEVAVACALADASYTSDATFGTAILTLLHRPPRHRSLADGAVVHVLIGGRADRRRLRGGAQLSGYVDTQAWLVLAHLAGLPLMFEGTEGPQALCWMLFDRVARHPALLRPPAPCRDAEPAGFHSHDLPRFGSVLCTQTGLVEPVLYSMWIQAHYGPAAFVELAQRAVAERDFVLSWRVYTVAQALVDSAEDNVRAAASAATAFVTLWWGPNFEALHGQRARTSCGAPASNGASP